MILNFFAFVAMSNSNIQDRWVAQEHYSKFEYMISMRDGIKLYTAVYVPKDKPGKHPILMERTPYGAGPKGADRFVGFDGSRKFIDAGYIYAYQDVRGKGFSEGDFINVRPQLQEDDDGIDESTDTFDTIEFLIKNVPDNNQRVGLWGISYPGFYAGAGGINSHPALKAISPQAPVSDWFLGDDVHHNGAMFLQDNFDFSTFFDRPRPRPGEPPKTFPTIDRGDGIAYNFFLKTGAMPNFDKIHYQYTIPYWTEIMDHDTYDDYWKARSLPRHFKNVKCAVLTVGGWFDAEDLWGALNLYAYGERQNKGAKNYLVMGPWFHGMWAGGSGQKFGDLDFGSNTSQYFQDNIEFPFFDKFLREQDIAEPAEATVFETGNNKWHTFSTWPPKNLKTFSMFLSDNKSLSETKPASTTADSYVADPFTPTPYLADYLSSRRRTREYMIDDQRFASARSDVLSYVSEVLENDKTIVGNVTADLWVKTTGTDGDFIVKVIDVWPADSTEKTRRGESMANYQQNLRWDVFRGKFRNSFEKPEPFLPNAETRVKFDLNATFHTFKKGHRIMIQIQSYAFPLVNRNPNKFTRINHALDSEYMKATVSILKGGNHASNIQFRTF